MPSQFERGGSPSGPKGEIEMNLEQALAKVEREQNMMARVHRNTSTADVDAALQQKIQRGEKLDDLEKAVAINRGYIK